MSMNKYIDMIVLEEQKKKRQEEILSSTEYISWLNNFTKLYPTFSTDDWLYNDEKLEKEDMNNVYDIRLLYQEIERYAITNYINPIQTKYGIFYQIKFDNVGYKIGIDFSRGVIYCYRVDIDNNFIDFNDILNNKEQEKEKNYKNKLIELDNILLKLRKEGIPSSYIEKHVAKVLKKRKEK